MGNLCICVNLKRKEGYNMILRGPGLDK